MDLSNIFFENQEWEAAYYYANEAFRLDPARGTIYLFKGDVLINCVLRGADEKLSFEDMLILRMAFEYFDIARRFQETKSAAEKRMQNLKPFAVNQFLCVWGMQSDIDYFDSLKYEWISPYIFSKNIMWFVRNDVKKQ